MGPDHRKFSTNPAGVDPSFAKDDDIMLQTKSNIESPFSPQMLNVKQATTVDYLEDLKFDLWSQEQNPEVIAKLMKKID